MHEILYGDLHENLVRGGLHENLVWGIYMKISPETPNFVKIRQKYRAFYVKNAVNFIVSGDVSSP